MYRVIKELIYEFKKFEREFSREEAIRIIYNEAKLSYPGVTKSKVQEMVESYLLNF